jgi:hypothetical protein
MELGSDFWKDFFFFLFSFLTISEEDIKEYTLLADSEDFSFDFLSAEIWIPN